MSESEVFLKILKDLSNKFPIKRICEFAVLKYLLINEEISLEKAKSEILKYIDNIDDESVIHSLNCLNGSYYDSYQLKNHIKCFELKDGILGTTMDFKKIVQNQEYRTYIEALINYALIKYEKEFEDKYYGIPFFKLYEQYQMTDAALLSNYTKTHSAFRGSGLITNGNQYFFFIDLHKEENIKESINCNDKFLDRQYFQWQSPNSTSQSSERGKNIIFNRDRGVNLHIFVRKYKQIDGIVQPYIYIGKGDVVEYNGEKPITVKMKLQNIAPVSLCTENL